MSTSNFTCQDLLSVCGMGAGALEKLAEAESKVSALEWRLALAKRGWSVELSVLPAAHRLRRGAFRAVPWSESVEPSFGDDAQQTAGEGIYVVEDPAHVAQYLAGARVRRFSIIKGLASDAALSKMLCCRRCGSTNYRDDDVEYAVHGSAQATCRGCGSKLEIRWLGETRWTTHMGATPDYSAVVTFADELEGLELEADTDDGDDDYCECGGRRSDCR